MFNPRFRKRLEPWLPKFFLRWVNPYHAVLNDRLAEAAAALPAGSWVLDAGAGECPHRPLFAHTRYVTVDLGIGDAAWDYTRVGVLGDIHTLPFRDQSFDAVVNISVLEHLKEPRQAVSEFARVLKPGGRLLLSTVQCWEMHQKPNDFFRFTRYGLEYLFDKAGLVPERVEALGGYFWLLAFRLINVLSFFQKGWRWAVFVLLAPFFGFLFPVILYYMDPLDQVRDFTLGYWCQCRSKCEPRAD
jgi:SAM-dependent methyltransferase